MRLWKGGQPKVDPASAPLDLQSYRLPPQKFSSGSLIGFA
jgi:hypothetical protein